jgi:Rrf2 family protein
LYIQTAGFSGNFKILNILYPNERKNIKGYQSEHIKNKEVSMRVSRSTGYALLAAGYIARHSEHKIILSQSIAKEYGIPLEYLLKLLQQLVRANVLRSKRGPRGGFSLAKTPKKISLLEIIEAVDGPMAGQLNLAEHAPKDTFCNKAEQVYAKAIEQAKAIFEKAKLADLLK